MTYPERKQMPFCDMNWIFEFDIRSNILFNVAMEEKYDDSLC